MTPGPAGLVGLDPHRWPAGPGVSYICISQRSVDSSDRHIDRYSLTYPPPKNTQ